jgi:type IV fimbrial biogenesis protein FimT
MKNRPSRESTQLFGHHQRGFTMIEILVSMTVIAILLGLAVPGFKEAMRNNRIVAQNNEFISALNYARSEAIRRGDTVSVCASTNGTGCSAATAWGAGWITFLDLNADGTTNGTDVVIQVSPPVMPGITINADALLTNVRFGGNGMLLTTSPTGNFLLQKTGCVGLYARQIAISAVGRVSTKKFACS